MTTIDTSSCTLSTCPISETSLGYVPNFGGNIFFVAWFAILTISQLVICTRHKTWSYLFGQFCGLILEAVGYGARVQLSRNPFASGPFILNVVAITIAPVFLNFTIYLCLGRVVLVFGRHLSRLPFRAYTAIFVGIDVLCLLLQAGGAAWTQVPNITPTSLSAAIKLLKAGLGLQVGSLAVFILLALDLGIRVSRRRSDWGLEYAEIRSKKAFSNFLIGFMVAALLILARCGYRIEELSHGFTSPAPDAETLYMIFEASLMGLAVLLLAVFHPGFVFGSQWKSTSFFARTEKGEADENTLTELVEQ
ncbi:RTA1 like protein-domain-containing protein [Xylariales sp. PMI_506]|nr:RTA1 like protein-domain-containing protein [Xylariales sp. PMI_506]